MRVFGFLWMCILAMCVTQSSLAQIAPPTETFVLPSENRKVSLSPDARHLAMIVSETNRHCIDQFGGMEPLDVSDCKEKKKRYRSKHTILVFNVDSLKVVKTLPLPVNFTADWLTWGNDDRLLASIRLVSTRALQNGKYRIGSAKIMSVPLIGDEPVWLLEDSQTVKRQNRFMSQVADTLPKDPEHILLPIRSSGQFDLWKVNILTGEGEVFAEGTSSTFAWFTDAEGEAALKFDCLGRVGICRTVIVKIPGDVPGEWKEIRRFKIKALDGRDDYEFWPLAFTDTPGEFLVIADEETDATASLKIYNVHTQEYTKTLFEDPNWDVGGALLDAKTRQYSGAWYYKDRLTFKLESTENQQYLDDLNKYFDDKENVDVVALNAARKRMVVFVSSPNNPGAYYLYNMETKDISLLFMARPDMDQVLYSKSEIFNIPTRDGAAVTAYLTSPEDSNGSATPLIVMPHGGPESRDYYDYDPWVQFFVSRNYQVLQVNFRGSSGYGREFTEAGYGEWGGVMQDDLTDAVKYVYDKDYASPDNTCIVGYSYGGYAALYGAATTPDLYKCIVSGGGVSDLNATMEDEADKFGKHSSPYAYWLDSIGDPKDEKEKLKTRSPVNLADQFEDPVLLLHGDGDSVVWGRQSKKMEKALKKAKKSIEYVALEKAGHSGWDTETEILYLESIERFLAKNLTGGSPPPPAR